MASASSNSRKRLADESAHRDSESTQDPKKRRTSNETDLVAAAMEEGRCRLASIIRKHECLAAVDGAHALVHGGAHCGYESDDSFIDDDCVKEAKRV